jgi:hypothetical protein
MKNKVQLKSERNALVPKRPPRATPGDKRGVSVRTAAKAGFWEAHEEHNEAYKAAEEARMLLMFKKAELAAKELGNMSDKKLDLLLNGNAEVRQLTEAYSAARGRYFAARNVVHFYLGSTGEGDGD